jgi:hypothetical protein
MPIKLSLITPLLVAGVAVVAVTAAPIAAAAPAQAPVNPPAQHFDVEQRLPESAQVARIAISSPAGNGTSLQATIPFDPAVGQVPPPA